MLTCQSHTLKAIKHLDYWNTWIKNSNFFIVTLKCTIPNLFFSRQSNGSTPPAFQGVLLLLLGKILLYWRMICITEMLFLLQLGVVIYLYWDFLGIFNVYLIEENLFLCNFLGCYVLSEVQLNDIVLSEEFQVP